MKKLFLALGLMTSGLVLQAQMERTVMVGGGSHVSLQKYCAKCGKLQRPYYPGSSG